MRHLPLLLATPAILAQSQPTFYAAYQDGLEAERQGKWAVAVAAFRRAVALRPDSAARVITYGNNLLTDYAPYSHLAKCHLELGEVASAQAMLSLAAAHHEPKAERDRLAKALPAAPPKPPPVEAIHPEPPSGGPGPSTAAPTPSAAPQVPEPAPAPQPPAAVTAVPAAAKPPSRNAPTVAPAPRGELSTRSEAGPGPGAPKAPAPTFAWIPWALAAAGLAIGGIWARRRGTRNAKAGDPENLGPYRIERLLGRGGFASTYLARHTGTGARVALKQLHPYRQEDAEFLGRFRQEARLGTRLNHPNLVRVVDPGPEEGTPWLAMEYVSGDRLDQRLKAQGRMPLPVTLRIALEIASAMAHAHELGIVHRDLKPGNVMFEGDRVKVMDFGISRTLDSTTLTTTYAFLGTPRYAAPEAQLKTQVGPAADRYSFGIILFELLTGAPPFEGETPFEILDQHRSRPLPDLAGLRPDLPPALVKLVHGLCAKVPEVRPEDVEILAVLEGLLPG